MAQSLLPEPVQSYEDSAGNPLNGGQLFTYSAGTLTPKATYQDAAGAIPNTNPIVLNERGEATLYGSGNYRMILKNALGATIWDRDNVTASAELANQLRADLANATDSSLGDALVAVKQPVPGSFATTQHAKNAQRVDLYDFGVASGDETAVFTAAAAASTPGNLLNVHVPDGVHNISGAVPAGPSAVNWDFSAGAVLTGAGSLPYQKATMTYNASPNYGARRSLWHGTDANPATDGVVATDYVQRVDQSVTADNPANLISTQYVTMKRKTGGTGWLYTSYNYLEDQSNSGAAQSVAVAGAAHATISAAVWGVYGESNSHSQFATIQGGEFDCFNNSGVDYAFNHLAPFSIPFSMGVWSIAFGGKKNSIGIGIGASNSPNTVNSSWHVGMYMAPWSSIEYGIDIQSQPKTIINFENGASTDGTGNTPGGIGLDCGFGAAYGTGANQCAIHLRNHRLGFGSFGFMQYNPGSNYIEFWRDISNRAAHLDLTTGVWAAG